LTLEWRLVMNASRFLRGGFIKEEETDYFILGDHEFASSCNPPRGQVKNIDNKTRDGGSPWSCRKGDRKDR
jgi:hypothetical protein